MKLIIPLIFCLSCYHVLAQQGRGAQIRLTARGMNYAASIGVQKLQQDLSNKRLNSVSGKSGDISYSASDITIKYIRVPSYAVKTITNTGLQLSVSGVSISASGRIHASFKKGWIKVSDSTHVKITGSSISFNLGFRFDARNGKPHVQAISCSTSIGHLDLDFSGGLSWVYNAISSIFSGKIKDILKSEICKEAAKLINNQANNFLANFPTQQNLDNVAIIDYSFQKPSVQSNYLDLLLRGEFLDPKNPKHSGNPPSFDTSSASNKMVYVWLSDYTLNSAGKVLHETGLLTKLVDPLSKKIPPSVKPFLNTKTFEFIIPELYKRFPNRPIEFQLATNAPPRFGVLPGNGKVSLNVRANVVVDRVNGSKLPVFYLDLNVNATGKVFVKSVNNQLNVGGNIDAFIFGASVGGSVLGPVNIPLDDPAVKQMVQALVIDNANPVLNKGFPIPKIKNLNFNNPQVSFVKSALRVDTDINYSG